MWSSGHARWVERSFSLGLLAGGFGSLLLAGDQLRSLDPWWLTVIAGGIVATSLLIPIYAWSKRGIHLPVAVLAVLLLVGIWTWPLAWRGGIATVAPFLWLLISATTVAVSFRWDTRVAVAYNLVCSLGYAVARLGPSGGAVTPILLLQDIAWHTALPLILLRVVSYTRALADELDCWLAASRRIQDDAAVRGTLVAERARLDSVIHDEIMTTLVAAGRATPGHAEHLAEQARSALASLDAEAAEDADAGDFIPSAAALVIEDVVESVCPTAVFNAVVADDAPPLPHAVVRAFTRAVRESVLNAERHSGAGRIDVWLRILASPDGTVAVRVAITDDGRGFEVDSVGSRRLGLELSVRSALMAVGGSAIVDSVVGDGTTIALDWTGEPGRTPRAGRHGTAPDGGSDTLARLDLRPLGVVSITALALVMGVGLLEATEADPAWPTVALAGFVAAVGWLPLAPITRAVSRWRIVVTTVAAIAIAVAGVSITAGTGWSEHATWWAHGVTMLAMAMVAHGRRCSGWAVGLVASVSVLLSTLVTGHDPWRVLPLIGLPLGWLVIAEMAVSWLARIRARADAARRDAEDARAESASSFGKLVLREVWLADLHELVDPLLHRVADAGSDLTDAERQSCLVLEGQLRDSIKSTNLVGPSISAQIAAARHRGVEVVLVDNRGDTLPANVRRIGLRYLEDVVRAAGDGRIVARTAPVGYDEVLTIVRVDSTGTSMVTIDNEGAVSLI